jgi:hypothetical protein
VKKGFKNSPISGPQKLENSYDFGLQ